MDQPETSSIGKRCSKCQKHKPLTEFHRDRGKSDARRAQCKACHCAVKRTRRAADVDRYRSLERTNALRTRYGISNADYAVMLHAQDALCAICRGACPTGKRLSCDHDHDTGVIRGLLCHGCNTSLGGLKDSPATLAASLRYLHAHGKALTSEDLASLVALGQL